MLLDDLREDINRIDKEIVKLLDERADAAKAIAREKAAAGLDLYDPEREKSVLMALSAHSNGSMPSPNLTRIYRTIMAETLAMETSLASDACHEDKQQRKIKSDVAASVGENREIAPGFWHMRLLAPALAGVFQPGQFFQLRINAASTAPFLRRPFAPSETASDGFSFVYAVVGEGTMLMTELQPGDQVRVLAPLGNAYTLPATASGEVALIGGGCGGPSLGLLAKELATRNIKTTVILGARTSTALLGVDTLSRHCHNLVTATDDGSEGHPGTALDALEKTLGDSISRLVKIYACGPVPMLKATAILAARHNIPCEVSLEERMACGFGACVGCAVEVKTPNGGTVFKRVCHDGPVFDPTSLAGWD